MLLWEIGEDEAIAWLDREINALLYHPQSNLALSIIYGRDFLERKRAWDRVTRRRWISDPAHQELHRQKNREVMRRKRRKGEGRADAG